MKFSTAIWLIQEIRDILKKSKENQMILNTPIDFNENYLKMLEFYFMGFTYYFLFDIVKKNQDINHNL